MIRKIIKIDKSLCNGCGACATACHEGAIEMIHGKATLTKENYCDGLGDCLPACPVNAITFEEREAPAYDEAAVLASKKNKENSYASHSLSNWPVQIQLAPVCAPYFDESHLLISADCTAYAYRNFHQELRRDHIVLIGCPKLDSADYTEKLTEIFSQNNIRSVTVARMEVPCCGGIEFAVKKALQLSQKWIPWQVITISTDGHIR